MTAIIDVYWIGEKRKTRKALEKEQQEFLDRKKRCKEVGII